MHILVIVHNLLYLVIHIPVLYRWPFAVPQGSILDKTFSCFLLMPACSVNNSKILMFTDDVKIYSSHNLLSKSIYLICMNLFMSSKIISNFSLPNSVFTTVVPLDKKIVVYADDVGILNSRNLCGLVISGLL